LHMTPKNRELYQHDPKKHILAQKHPYNVWIVKIGQTVAEIGL